MSAPELRLRPWRAGDEAAFDPRADMAEEMRANAWDWSRGPPGPCWAIVRDGEVLGIGGAVEGEGGAWMAWSQLSDLPRRAWPDVVRLGALALAYLRRTQRPAWIWAQCRAGRPGARRVLERLGFEPFEQLTIEGVGDVVSMVQEG